MSMDRIMNSIYLCLLLIIGLMFLQVDLMWSNDANNAFWDMLLKYESRRGTNFFCF